MKNLARDFAVMVLTVAMVAAGASAAATVGPVRPAPGAKTTAPADGPVGDLSAAHLKAEVLAGAARGKPTDALLRLFRDYTAARVRERYVPKDIPEDLWQWILASKDLRDAVLVGVNPENETDLRALGRLAALRARFGAKVDEFPHLALAFAIVYGHAGNQGLREPGLHFIDKDRPVPSMEDSFDYYLTNEKAMKMSLKTTPWPILIYVADNDLPIAERKWATSRYGGKSPGTYDKVYYDVPYDESAIGNDKGRLGESPRTLANILHCGGVCAHQAYYASRVFKSLGVPSLYDCGEGTRGGHAWVAWVGRATKTADLLFAGRFDYDRYYTGTVFEPSARRAVLDRSVQLDVAAMLQSYPGYLNAVAACRMYSMLDDATRAKATGLLDGAIRQNAYCGTTWRLMATDVAKGVIPRATGETMYTKMITAFTEYPDLTYEVLRMILEPRLKPSEKPAQKEIAGNLRLLDSAFALYLRSDRPDLAVGLRYLQGQYLEACGRREQAMKLYVMTSEKFATDHFGFVPLYDRACVLMKEDGKTDLMLKYMGVVAEKVPKFQSAFNRRNNLINPTFEYVVRAYVGALRQAGKKTDADAWAARAPEKPKT
ncbi:MAG: hypothetical protein IMZ55_18285 [Acidobacteria bacterium]|nr:hypothetical protein [Acidobacteriota bacterium]